MKYKWKCTICNYVYEGETPPDICPICGAPASAFVRVTETAFAFSKDTAEAFVIVGGGAAAFEAAAAIRKRNKTAIITMICGEGVLPYNRPGLSDLIGEGLLFDDILLQGKAFYDENKIELMIGSKAASVDRAAKTVLLEDGRAVPYDKLLIATGANSFNPVPSGKDAVPLFTLRRYADALAIMHAAKKGSRAVIVGGGILGVEAAIALNMRGVAVTVLEQSDRILKNNADSAAAAVIHDYLAGLGIGVITNASVDSCTQTGVSLKDGSVLEAYFVIVSAGVRPETTLAREAGLAVGRGIVVNASLQTADPYVYAAGDCAEVDGKVYGLWSSSVSQGAAAGASMAGEPLSYVPVIPATALELPGLSLFSAGNVNLDGAHTVTSAGGPENIYKKLVFDASGRLCGVVLVGDVGLSAAAMSLIEKGAFKKEALSLLI